MASAAPGEVSRHVLVSGNIPWKSPLVPGRSGPKRTNQKKRQKKNIGFAKMGSPCYAQCHGLGRSENRPKMRFFAPYSSARRDQRPPTMGMGRVDTPTWVVGGEPLVRSA